MTHPYVLYIVYCVDPKQRLRSYIGITNNLARRLRKHRGELKGGAKYTKLYTEQGCEWKLAATAHGCRDWNEVLRVEWALQHPGKSKHLKQRGPVSSNVLVRNLSNLFYLVHPKRTLSHIWATLHSVPPAVQRDILTERFDHFLLLPADLLLKNRYNDFLLLRNSHEGHTPPPVSHHVAGHRVQRKYTADHYREQARKLLVQSTERSLVSGSVPARRPGQHQQPICIIID